jgi:hypothetical protein
MSLSRFAIAHRCDSDSRDCIIAARGQGEAMSDAIEGGCQCGALRYRISGKPVALIACHCTECQRQSGSAFGMSLIVPRDSFEITGEPKVFTRTSDSGNRVDCAFCERCGTRIFHRPQRLPDTLNVKPGTLDDTSWLEPRAHVWTKSKQPWVPIPEGAKQIESQP